MKFILTGPESVGKSTLAKKLAKHFSGKYIAEYARDYVENLNRPYNYDDILHISKVQEKALFTNYPEKYIFFDTGLIITKIWAENCFQKTPPALFNLELKSQNFTYLLCKPDIEWFKDNVRENGGKQRDFLYQKYLFELKKIKAKYYIIEGKGEIRFLSVLNFVNSIK